VSKERKMRERAEMELKFFNPEECSRDENIQILRI